MMWNLTEKMKQAQGVTEDLKRRDQMAWVGAVNNIRNQIEEIIRNDLIYVLSEIQEQGLLKKSR